MYGNFTGNDTRNQLLEFQKAKLALVAAGLSSTEVEQAQLTQSYLRLEQPMPQNSNLITFPILNVTSGNNAIRPTEKRLTLQDAFYCGGINITLAQASSATAVNFVPVGYPSPTVFTVSGLAAALYTFYNGYYNITVNGTVIVPAYPTLSFLNVPQTQATAATNSPLDQFDGSVRQVLQPNPVFIGSKQSIFNIVMPGNIGIATANVFIVVELFGVLAQNVTVVS